MKSHREAKASAALTVPASSRRKITLCLACLLGLGLLIRVLHFWALSGTAFPRIPFFTQSDMHTFWQWAQTILAGDLLGRDPYHPYFDWMKPIAPLETWYRWWGGKAIFQQAPFYPYWLAGLLAVSGNSMGFVLLVQLLVGALHPLVIFWLARRMFDERVGLIAAGLTAFYGPFIFHQGTLLRDWLPPLVEPLALLALLRARASGRAREWLLAGAALGGALLITERILLFAPMAFLWLLLEYRGAFRVLTVSSAALLLGALLVLSPLLLRNALVGAPILSLSNRAAEGVILGNAADGYPVGVTWPASMKGILERSNGRLGAVIRETLATFHGDWRALATLSLVKLRGLADPMEVPDNLNFYYGLEISPALRVTLRYGVIFPLGLAGFLLSLLGWRRHCLLAFYGAAVVGSLLAGNIVARYRLVLAPILIIYGARAAAWFWEASRRRQIVRCVACLTLVLGLAAVQHLVVPLQLLRENGRYAVHRRLEYVYSAVIYASEGQFDRAVAEITRLEAKVGGNPRLAGIALEAFLDEGNVRARWAGRLIEEGKREEARQQVELAEAAYAKHPGVSYPAYNLGRLYLALNMPARAIPHFQQFLNLEPSGPLADWVRGALARSQGSP